MTTSYDDVTKATLEYLMAHPLALAARYRYFMSDQWKLHIPFTYRILEEKKDD